MKNTQGLINRTFIVSGLLMNLAWTDLAFGDDDFKTEMLRKQSVSEVSPRSRVALVETYYGERFRPESSRNSKSEYVRAERVLRNKTIRSETGRLYYRSDIDYIYSPQENERAPHEKKRAPHERSESGFEGQDSQRSPHE